MCNARLYPLIETSCLNVKDIDMYLEINESFRLNGNENVYSSDKFVWYHENK